MKNKKEHSIYTPHKMVRNDGSPELSRIFTDPFSVTEAKNPEDMLKVGKRHLMPAVKERLHLLSPEGRRLVDEHLEKCEECRNKFA